MIRTTALNITILLCLLANIAYAENVTQVKQIVSKAQGEFLGAESCKGCHDKEYQLWRKSDHFQAMQPANEQSVLGDFNNVTVNFHNISSRLYRQGDRYLIDTLDDDGQPKTFQIRQTFGFYPLQQYLVETQNGHVQALNIAWDSRSKEQGGQHWYHLRAEEKITPEHPFYWTNHFQNWNSRCAECHSTNVEKNYSADTHSYNTTWSEINVACESCHGPAKQHVELVTSDKFSASNSGFAIKAKPPLSWQFKAGDAIAQPHGVKTHGEVDMCGRCHALRSELVENNHGQSFLDNSRLQLLSEGSYFGDGQIQEEVFVMGSFLQSKMYQKGVTCSNCHNPHSGKISMTGNGLCGQCHNPETFDTPKHHHHNDASEGAACVNCHMPERTYMGVDARRDHSFNIPRPDLSIEFDVPNVCVDCHSEDEGKDNIWASQQLLSWGIQPSRHWAQLNARAQNGDVMITKPLTDTVNNTGLADIVRASLLQQLAPMPSRLSVETAQKNLQDDSPLVRRAAVNALQGLPIADRWQLLSGYMNDRSRAVRFAVAENLAGVSRQLRSDQLSILEQSALSNLIVEYRRALQVNEDSPATQVAIASLEMQLGNVSEVEKAFQQALRIEPSYVPALVNLADYYRQTNKPEQSAALLRQALKVAPDSAAVQYGYSLLLIRQGDYQSALTHLQEATQLPDAAPRYAYVYAVTMENQQQLAKAISILTQANERWPNQYELLITLVRYLEQSGQEGEAYKYISRLTFMAPNSPEVKDLVNKYRN